MDALPMTNRTLVELKRCIDKIKVELSGIDEMRPGSLTQQFKDRESQTGPYYQLSYTFWTVLSSPSMRP